MDQEIPDISASQAEIPDISDSQACKPTTSKAHINDVRNAAATLVLFLGTHELHDPNDLNEADGIMYSKQLRQLMTNAKNAQTCFKCYTDKGNDDVAWLESIDNFICEIKEQALYLCRAKALKAKKP